MRIAYSELTAALALALEKRGLAAEIRLLPIDPPRAWGVTCNACFTLAGQYAAAEIATVTAGLEKKAAKEAAARLSREAGSRLAAEVAAELNELCAAGQLTAFVATIEAEGAYLNFYYNARALADLVIATTNLPDPTPDNPLDDFGSGTVPQADRKQIMVEYAQPNTHKDFHVGHLRNASIGQAIANLLEFSGHTVYKATYLGDVGAHVAKAIYGARGAERGNEDALEFWGRAYQAAQDAPKEELVAWLDRWESGDAVAREQWQTSRDECVAAFKAIFAELNVDFHPDCWFYESTVDDSHLGQKTAEELKQHGVAIIDESEEYKGALYVDFAAQADAVKSGGREQETEARQPGTAVPLNPLNVTASEPQPVFSDAEKKRIRQLGKMTILRSNGTSLYQTKELGLAKYKFDWVKQQTGRDLDESLYVVGAEQKLYFEQVFAILRLWGFPNADKCKHIAYELVVLPEGKMSSREGTVVSYRELRDAAVKQAQDVIREKGIITDEAQIEQTAHAVAIAAIKYTMLQVSGNQQIVFDFAQALSFDGRAAPYLQYAYARAGKLVVENKQQSTVSSPQSAERVPDLFLSQRESASEPATQEGFGGAAVPGCHSPEGDKWQGIAPELVEDFHIYRQRLPHWRQTGRMYFVTWRQLKGAEPFTDTERDLIASVIRHFEGERYFLYAFVVMDDHVHVLVQPHYEHSLASIEHSWKSYGANRLQREHGRQGQVWQDESYDRIVRDEEELHQKAYYILTNPQRRWGNDIDYKWVYLNQEWPELEDKAGQPGTAAPLDLANAATLEVSPKPTANEDQGQGLHPSEIALARLLSQFPETCRTAAERYEPAVLCNYLYAIADAFSAFYRDCRVLGAPEPELSFRQGLTRAFRYVLRTGFKILALPLPEAM